MLHTFHVAVFGVLVGTGTVMTSHLERIRLMSASTTTPDPGEVDRSKVHLQLTGANQACLTLLEALHAADFLVANASSPGPAERSRRLVRMHADITLPSSAAGGPTLNKQESGR